jgi:hypothetical protein
MLFLFSSSLYFVIFLRGKRERKTVLEKKIKEKKRRSDSGVRFNEFYRFLILLYWFDSNMYLLLFVLAMRG